MGAKPGLTLREEHRLRGIENKVLRRIFGPKMEEVTGRWRKLHNEGLRDLYSLPSILRIIKSRRMRWGVKSGYGTGTVCETRKENVCCWKHTRGLV
jgi:hypothetical protein